MLERLSIACSTSGGTETFDQERRHLETVTDRRIDERQQPSQFRGARPIERRNLRLASASVNTLTMRERIVSLIHPGGSDRRCPRLPSGIS
jgi:hypothetical protein